MTSSGETTVRAQHSREQAARFDSLLLRWLFPNEIVATIRLSAARNVVGRDANCAVHLDMPSVSRRHAEIYRDGPVFALKDRGSTNGTFLNGRRISHTALAPGDVLRIGESVALVAETQTYESAPRLSELAPSLFGGPAFERLLEPVRQAASSALPIVLVGETGSGKEHVARAIHHWSGRSGPFLTIPCAALRPDFTEEELFGEPASTLGAEATVLIDCLAELPLAPQAKLLRTVERLVVSPGQEASGKRRDARLITATERPLDELVQERLVRRDLKSRLSGLVVPLSALRVRRDEIPGLFAHFTALHSGGRSPPAEARLIEALCLHEWPDNLRELELLAKKLLTLYGSEPLLKRSMLDKFSDFPSSRELTEPESAEPRFRRRADHDRFHLIEALKKAKGNVSAAAASLGFSRQRAYRLMNGKAPAELMAECEGTSSFGGRRDAHSE